MVRTKYFFLSTYTVKSVQTKPTWCHDSCDHMVVRFTTTVPVQSVPITTKGVISNPTHGEVYPIQHYVIKFVSFLRQVGGFHRVLCFPPSIKLTAMNYIL